ncbi:MAG: diguanylate cyclase [Spirochaetota bacterium]|nr:diguanylate cyclase [Spirochaetota bacterium]
MNQILIADDSKVIYSILKKKIEMELHYEVKWVKTYFDALKLINTDESGFMAALVGLYLPDSPDGEIVDYIISKNIPTIVFTGDPSDEVRKKIWSKKVFDYVLKEGGHNNDYIISLLKRINRNKSIKILVADDSSIHRAKICDLLRVHLYNVLEASDCDETLSILDANQDTKMVITDFEMPNMNGFQLIKDIRTKYNKEELSIIVMSGDNSLSARYIKYGANDFITKNFFTEEFYCRVTQNIELVEHIKEIKDSSNKDYLTDMFNRKYFFEVGKKLYANSKRKNLSISVAMIDIDYFKRINDAYGHDVGDLVIKSVGNILKNRFRESDVVARFGGEEFCILTCNMKKEHTEKIFNNLRENIEHSDVSCGNKIINYTVSIGVCTEHLNSLEEMIKEADIMLYKAKEAGRNRVCL